MLHDQKIRQLFQERRSRYSRIVEVDVEAKGANQALSSLRRTSTFSDAQKTAVLMKDDQISPSP